MLLTRLTEYYGIPGEAQKSFIDARTQGMPENRQDEIAQAIIEERTKRFGFPDVSVLSKYLPQRGTNTSHKYYWCVCNDCGAEYDYGFITCPSCFQAGKKSSGYTVKVSEYQPPIKVIRWNKNSLSGGENSCIECQNKNNSYCRNFGNPNWTCNQSDYEYCNCKKCCAKRKRENARIM